MERMETFVRHHNIQRFRNLLARTVDETQRQTLLKLLAEEEMKEATADPTQR
jgi:hypothetical protein